MIARLFSLAFLCMPLAIFLPSCDDEAKNNSVALIGRWEIVQGYRNQKPTETLAGTYFQFGDDGKMQTNLPIGPEEPMDYSVGKQEIRQKSVPPMKYSIQNISDTSLVLGFQLRGMQFEMHFRRAIQVDPDSSLQLLPDPDSVPAPVKNDSVQ